MVLNRQPIANIEWVDARELQSNDYNPNVVLNQELKLLEFSLLKQGWIQPILISQDKIIIDGFHRYWLSVNSAKVIDAFNYKVPVVKLELSRADRMLLTIRINRAKGNHIAYKMHEIVYKLIHDMGVPESVICEEIGATKKEIELLSKKDVFDVLNIKDYKYSKAWEPKRKSDHTLNKSSESKED